jgi:uracil phosphoribosyltransferase
MMFGYHQDIIRVITIRQNIIIPLEKYRQSVIMNNIFESKHPLVAHKLTRLRDKNTKSKKFRELIREISALLVFEATTDLELTFRTVETPLGKASGAELKQTIGLVPILRSGLGMVEGIWGLMPSAEVWHIGLYRDEETLQPVEYYSKLPLELKASVCLVLDPMLATGGSAVATVNILKDWGADCIKFIGILAAPEGVKAMQSAHPDVPLHLAVIDKHLNKNGYIVPGLGDAGDRQFGTG